MVVVEPSTSIFFSFFFPSPPSSSSSPPSSFSPSKVVKVGKMVSVDVTIKDAIVLPKVAEEWMGE